MLNKRSLRFRVSVTFMALSALLSTLFALAIVITAERMEQGYIAASLEQNLAMLVSERHQNPTSNLPYSKAMKGYAVARGSEGSLPAHVRDLPAGNHELNLPGHDYQIAVRDEAGTRYVLTFDITSLEFLESQLVTALVVGVMLFSYLGLWLGFWASGRIIDPVTSLARQIQALGDDVGTVSLEGTWGDDEVGRLAGSFERYARRLGEFIQREREFTAYASHELRTPVMVAASTLELVEARSGLDEYTRQHLRRLQRAVQRMASLVDVFLLLAREDSPAQASAQPPIELEPLVRQAIADRRESAEHKGLALALGCSGRPTVNAPPTAVLVVLDNLLGNAVNHSGAGRIDVTLDEHGVTVRDTGPGIPADEIHKVLERYVRGSRVRNEGTGLGLAIVERLCGRYGWRFTLTSLAAQGTAARVDIRGPGAANDAGREHPPPALSSVAVREP